MNTQQLIDAVRGATKTICVSVANSHYEQVEEISYIDAEVLLGALESMAEAEKEYRDDLWKRCGI